MSLGVHKAMGEEKYKSTPRKRRKKCQRLCVEDPEHVCSPQHVRVPAHCRLKRNKKKGHTKRSKLDVVPETATPVDNSITLLPVYSQPHSGTL